LKICENKLIQTAEALPNRTARSEEINRHLRRHTLPAGFEERPSGAGNVALSKPATAAPCSLANFAQSSSESVESALTDFTRKGLLIRVASTDATSSLYSGPSVALMNLSRVCTVEGRGGVDMHRLKGSLRGVIRVELRRVA
jgi:hypothetical protein